LDTPRVIPATPPRRLRLGEILASAGAVSEEQLAEGLRESRARGERLGRALLRLGYATEDAVLAGLARQLSLERVDLARLPVPPEAARALPLDFVRRHQVLPIALRNGTVRVATADPGNRRVVEDLRLLSGLEVEEALATESEIREKIAESYGLTVERMIEDLHAGEAAPDLASTSHDIEVMANEPTVVNLVNLIISTALRERASDIHLVPFEKTLELRYRIDGILQLQPPPPKHLHAALVSRIKIMGNMNIAERYIPQDGHFQIQSGGRRVDVRVGTMPTMYGESSVLRLLEKGARVLTPVELGLDAGRAGELLRLAEKPYGIILATGPTGCGKTTTIYSILTGIYTTEKKILTIEDPVEYELPGVGQIPVRPARGFTFATGLRSILRQDPDVIMVGEIRDSETAEIAIRAALTGHLVFSTLHTNDAAGAITRLLDMGIEAFLISSSLEGVLAQRLVRRVCAACRREAPLAAETIHKLESLGIDPGPGPHYQGAGCEECRGTGYRGRTGLFELLAITPELRDLIVSRRPATEIKEAAAKRMLTLRNDGLAKARAGLTTLDEMLRVALGGLA
jgi:type II secretory ATPase GspE/PulE/Tfp pilus assembly ATPase PilB-like protein